MHSGRVLNKRYHQQRNENPSRPPLQFGSLNEAKGQNHVQLAKRRINTQHSTLNTYNFSLKIRR